MKKILVVGAFGDKTGRLDGQIVKTRNVYSMLQDKLAGIINVNKFNTLSVRYNKLRLIELFLKLLFCDIVILIPADYSLEKFFPHLYRLSKIVKFKIIQLCVGGWQVDFFIGRGIWPAHPQQLEMSKKCWAFLPEIEKVNEELKSICNFKNCEVFPNFRRNIPNIHHVNNSKELKLVWLARINKNKGFETVFQLAEKIENIKLNISISFYGKVEECDKELFHYLLAKHDGVVKYYGQLPSEKIFHTLCDYDIMLLPTRYYTEGFPGTVLDAYISGLPVIATEWMHSHEFIEEGVSGFIVPFNAPLEELFNKVFLLYSDRSILNTMKRNSRAKVSNYTEERAWDIIKKYLK